MNIFLKGSPKTNSLAITFDDGPHPIFTPQLLDILNKYNAKATFFMTAINASQNKDLVLDVIKQGHEIGNHSLNHDKKLFFSSKKLISEIKTAKDIIEEITTKPVTLYRPPYGFILPSLFSACKKLNLKIILWNVMTYDYRREHFLSIIRRISGKIKPGSIFLFHECHFKKPSLDYSNTVKAVGHLLINCSSMKIKPVTISRLLKFED